VIWRTIEKSSTHIISKKSLKIPKR